MSIDFNQMISNYVAADSWQMEVGRYYPSAIGGCLRAYWYSYKHPKPFDADMQKIFHLGDVVHDFIVQVLESKKNPHVELVKKEFPVRYENAEPKFTVSGRVDDVMLVKSEGKQILVEVKSHGNLRWLKGPDKKHVMQLQFYMSASGIHNGVLLYVDRANLQTKSYDVKYDKDEADKIIQRFAKFHKHLTENTLPAAEAKTSKDTSWMCKRCAYAEMCEKDRV